MTTKTVEPFVKTSCGRQVFQLRLDEPYMAQCSFFGEDEFVALVINSDPQIAAVDRERICERLVSGGCRYAVCTGFDCTTWDDAIDWANLELNAFDVDRG